MIPTLCFVTDAAAPSSVVDQAVAAARGGAGWIQLRDKALPDREFAELARVLIARLHSLNATLIVNDRVDVAREVGARGLHIGQGDGDPVDVRKAIGPGAILGLSIETVEQVKAIPAGVDYLGVGPIHATASKHDHAAPIGIGGFADVVALTSLPCLAIGSVTARDANALKAAGGAGMAVVSAISRAPDMERAARTLLKTWSQA